MQIAKCRSQNASWQRGLMPLRRNILLFHSGALGDFIVTWPLALGLGRVFAQSRVFYVTGAQKGALAEKALRVDCTDVENGWHHLFSAEPELPEPASKLLTGAQWIISFLSGPEDLWARNVRALAPDATVVTIGTIPPAGFSGHVTGHFLQQLKPWPVLEAAMSQMLCSIASRGLGLARGGNGSVVIHPGAGSGTKCWPPEKFMELVGLITASGRRAQVLLGEVELERWPLEQIEAFSRMAEVLRPNSLVELMQCLTGAAAFVGNDSGPGHLAGILGVPTVSIFGPTDPARWKPLGPRVTPVTGELDKIATPMIYEAVQRALSLRT
jgi:heptosyltransferase III